MEQFKKLYEYIDSVCEKLPDEKLKKSFRKCYLNTLETTVKYDKNGEVFVITGDIEAMWLRDSSVQVSHYVRLAAEDPDCATLVRSLLRRQFGYINEDPYANAFNECANGKGHTDDETKQNPIVFERKYEIDSLIYPLWLTDKYYRITGDGSVFDGLFFKTYDTILLTLHKEQDFSLRSDYYFRRPRENKDSLDNNGFGGDYAYTGMVRSAFRPSDDRCLYTFLVPANAFIVAVLKAIEEDLVKESKSDGKDRPALKLADEVQKGIEKFGTVEHEKYGRIYAYEVDGLGNALLMDDANVPSLLSLPYLGYCDIDDEIYKNTRAFVLSKDNPFYFEGKYAKGVGSPHTPDGYIWHIALVMEALTTDDDEKVAELFTYLTGTDAGTGFMHESFDPDKPEAFTRKWFAWANTLFSIFIIDKYLPTL